MSGDDADRDGGVAGHAGCGTVCWCNHTSYSHGGDAVTGVSPAFGWCRDRDDIGCVVIFGNALVGGNDPGCAVDHERGRCDLCGCCVPVAGVVLVGK